MRIELILLFGAGFIMANIYTEGKYFKKLLEWEKYYQMIGVAAAALTIYWLIKKDPRKAKDIITTSNEYLKYLPIDQNSSRMISPVLDFTGGALTGAVVAEENNNNIFTNNPIVKMFSTEENRQRIQEN